MCKCSVLWILWKGGNFTLSFLFFVKYFKCIFAYVIYSAYNCIYKESIWRGGGSSFKNKVRDEE